MHIHDSSSKLLLQDNMARGPASLAELLLSCLGNQACFMYDCTLHLPSIFSCCSLDHWLAAQFKKCGQSPYSGCGQASFQNLPQLNFALAYSTCQSLTLKHVKSRGDTHSYCRGVGIAIDFSLQILDRLFSWASATSWWI